MKQNILEWTKTIAISIIIALIITTFVRPTLVMQYSMHPTIEEHDYLLVNKIVYKFKEISFGDIIVFESSLKTEEGKNKQLIKRVIGIPGDVLEIKEGVVYRNGEALEEPYINGDYTSGYLEETEINENELFVMGDNRPSSVDSRSSEVGTVSIDNVMGKVLIRLYPFNKIGFVE